MHVHENLQQQPAKMRKAGREETALAADTVPAGTWSPNIARCMADVSISLVQVEEFDRMPLPEALDKFEHLLGELDTERVPEGRECIICCTELRNMRFLPCGHMLLCQDCLNDALTNCYQCRAQIAGSVRDFPQTDTFVQT